MTPHSDPAVAIRREIEIFAPPDLIWDWISRVDLWSDWHPDVSSSRWLGEPGPDGRFKWRNGLLGVDSSVTVWRQGREFGWSGRAWLFRTRQTFRIDGDFRSTKVYTEQTLEGASARVMAPLIRGYIARWSEVWLAILKTRIEGAHERRRERRTQPVPTRATAVRELQSRINRHQRPGVF